MLSDHFDPSIFDEVLAGGAIAGLLFSSPLLRPWYARWGATRQEDQRALPGDEIAPNPSLQVTRAITIQAPADRVWAWLVQIGQERGGLYTYQRIENLIGCKLRNANQIHPEWQHPKIGDNVRLGPRGYPLFRIVGIEPGCALVMQACDPVKEEPGPASWVFVLEALDGNTTRLITRSRNQFEHTFANTLLWRGVTDPIHFVMERGMLLGIKQRAEAGQATV